MLLGRHQLHYGQQRRHNGLCDVLDAARGGIVDDVGWSDRDGELGGMGAREGADVVEDVEWVVGGGLGGWGYAAAGEEVAAV